MKLTHTLAVISVVSLAASSAGAADGNAENGQRAFRACAPCHSLEQGRQMTGPSLAHLWQRHAGTLPGFERYSPALKGSGVVWDDATLDGWIADPQSLIPGNTMTFNGIKDARTRADLIAFLKQATESGHAPQNAQQPGGMGMMGGGQVPNLKQVDAGDRVQAIRHCRDTYKVTTADGQTHDYWERNLRFKTDSSSDGPTPGVPAIVGAGMMGDRASVIFAAPAEISRFIADQC
jgi:cytochrome c